MCILAFHKCQYNIYRKGLRMINIDVLGELSNAFGPCGFEDEVALTIARHSNKMKVTNDSMGNVYMELENNTGKRPRVMIDCHMDECAYMIQAILPNGLLSILTLGGIHLTCMPGHGVIVKNQFGDKYRGILTTKPVHFMNAAQKMNTSLDIENIYIDLGASCREEIVKEYKICVGDTAVPDTKFFFDEKRQMCIGKAFDNRLGCAGVLETMKRLNEETCLQVDVIAAFATQEELGGRGAAVTVQNVKPDVVIVFEGTPADDPYYPAGTAQGALRQGVQIRHIDSGYLSQFEFIRFAHKIGELHGVKYQDAVRRGSFTNASSIGLLGKGVPILVLGLPARYVHSHYNFCYVSDIEETIKLAINIIKNLSNENLDTIYRKNLLNCKCSITECLE